MKKYVLLFGAVGTVLIAFAFTTNTKNSNQEEKITICHFPPGNPLNAQIITISASARSAHEAHEGDYVVTENTPPCPCLTVDK